MKIREHNCLRNSRVFNSREAPNNQIRRRRECLVCGRRWSTREADIDSIVTKDDHKEFVLRVTKILDSIKRLRNDFLKL